MTTQPEDYLFKILDKDPCHISARDLVALKDGITRLILDRDHHKAAVHAFSQGTAQSGGDSKKSPLPPEFFQRLSTAFSSFTKKLEVDIEASVRDYVTPETEDQ